MASRLEATGLHEPAAPPARSTAKRVRKDRGDAEHEAHRPEHVAGAASGEVHPDDQRADQHPGQTTGDEGRTRLADLGGDARGLDVETQVVDGDRAVLDRSPSVGR